MDIIQTRQLTKIFGDTAAVENLSINVRQSEIYGFLGLNGAGKTTTIRMLLGMIGASKGDVLLFGSKARQGAVVWNDVGYLVETPYSYPNLTVRENLEVIRLLRGLPDRKVIDEIMERMHLSQYENKQARHLSLGNNQRLGLAKAIMHKPKLLILDEPVNGLDPAGIVEVRELLKDLSANHGTTIFLSSHILSEISRMATRIGIVHRGRLVIELNTEELEKQLIKKLLIDTRNNKKALEVLKSKGYEAGINGSSLIESVQQDLISKPETAAAILVESGVPPHMIRVYEEDLETYFLRIIGE